MYAHCRCRFTPRSYQQQVLDLVAGAKADERKWYVVCPPGSGKTILGLMIAVRLNEPVLVLAPNTAIQAQWVQKTSFFLPEPETPPIASTDPEAATPILVLTYQALARTGDFDDIRRAELLEAWAGELVESRGDSLDEARDWLADYEAGNPERFQASLLGRWKRLRLQAGGEPADGLLAPGAIALMERLRDRGVKLVIFDECHHLVGYWAQMGLALCRTLGEPRVLGLTATPPAADDLSEEEVKLHLDLLHDVDFALPTPAVVRDGNLAPFQDLVYFTRPTEGELGYIKGCSHSLERVMSLVEQPSGRRLSSWLREELDGIPAAQWAAVLRRRAGFIEAAVRYLRQAGVDVPSRASQFGRGALSLDEQADLVSRFATHALLVSPAVADRELYRELNLAFRPLGFRLTEAGLRRCQSTVNRVLALSESKLEGMVAILTRELAQEGLDVRALVITDFERSSATIDKAVEHLLTSESGGAIAAMRTLTRHPATDRLDPILVTGQTVLVDDDLLPRFLDEATAWFARHDLAVAMEPVEEAGFYRISGTGPGWTTRHYVMMITDLFERGITRCLVGTRGLLGEGWDSLTANTLIDLTTAATAMTVNQLRGRAIRLDPAWPGKTANIWDVVCLAPEFAGGLSDYHRFARKHAKYFGLCDDGAIEYGLGHLHPALTEAGPEDVALNAHLFNAEMLERCTRRAAVREAWRIGTPYENVCLPTLELKVDEAAIGGWAVRGPLDHLRGYEVTVDEVLANLGRAILESLRELGELADPQAVCKVTERADRYFRVFFASSSETDMRLLATCLAQLFEPLAEQRYMIPRYEERRHATWLSRLLPEVIGRYLHRRRHEIAIYHPLPEIFGSAKERAELFSDKWNLFVSPGRAIYTKRGEGEQLLAEARPQSQTVMSARTKLKSVWR